MRNPRNERAALAPASRPASGRGSRGGPTPNPSRNREGPALERTCVLTRQKGERVKLIRLALGPDGVVAPDVRARAPGRGAWISVGRDELGKAVASGKLKTALQRAFRTSEIHLPPDLADRTMQALRQAALDRLGMEARAGNLINGADKVEAAARAGKVHLLVHAADAGEDGRRKLDQALRVGARAEGSGRRGVIFPEGRSILSMALGRENVVHAALIDPAAAARVLDALVGWRDFIAPEAGLEGGDPASGTGSAEDIEGIE